jgi:hypothetical protein
MTREGRNAAGVVADLRWAAWRGAGARLIAKLDPTMCRAPTGADRTRGSGPLRAGGVSGLLGRAGGWGRACGRTVRGQDGPVHVVPRRSRCTGCRATQVLLPVLVLARRAATATVIGAALAAKAAGLGAPTDRRWIGAAGGDGARLVVLLRRPYRAGAGGVHWVASALALDPVLPDRTGSEWADARP